jgi:predicted NBD/HSP70 family sugar kinase
VLTQIVDLVRRDDANSRPQLEALTGLGRAVVNERLADGIELGVLEELEAMPTTGQRGRPSRTVRFRSDAGVVLSACLGAVSLHAAVSDLAGNPLGRAFRRINVADGPRPVLGSVQTLFRRLLARVDGDTAVWGIAIGVPGPVEFRTGRVVAPPIMPGWDGYDVRDHFYRRFGAPVWVDNEVNLMALGEWHRGEPREGRDLLYVKVSTGIGSGLVTGGQLHRGDSGAAGDIGHVRVTADRRVHCRCGKTGCLEAVAGGWALQQRLEAVAADGTSSALAKRLASHGHLEAEDIGLAVAEGDAVARSAVVHSARVTGQAIAGVVNFANPGTLVLGGGAIRHGPLFFEEFRKSVLEGAIELAARNLTIRQASLDFNEGTIGGSILAAENLLRPQALRLWLADGNPRVVAEQLQGAA